MDLFIPNFQGSQATIMDAPFYAHDHPREGEMLKEIIHHVANLCQAAVIMNNLKEPTDDLDRLIARHQEIREATKAYPDFLPVMSIMMTPRTTVNTIRACAPDAKLLKLIPTGASTNSQTGVALENLKSYYPVLEELEKQGMIFSVHAERTHDDNGEEIPESDREEAAISIMERIIRDFPGLHLSIEHPSTKRMCELVLASSKNVVGPLTVHHPLFNDLLLRDRFGKINPDWYCKPVLKSEENRRFIEEMMLSGLEKFFLGPDSAAHPYSKKFDTYPPYAGIYSAPVIMPLLAECFARAGKLDRLENFSSTYGMKFYGLKKNSKKIIVWRDDEPWTVPEFVGSERIPVLMGGRELYWRAEPY